MSLPVVEYTIQGGLYTKARQDDVSALLQAQNVDYYDVAGGVGKVPGTARRSATAGSGWQSLHHHSGYLSGVLTRSQYGLAGTTLTKINTDQTLASLKTGLTAEPLYSVSSQDRLHLASANNTPVKIALDDAVSNWGVASPTSACVATQGSAGNVDKGVHRYVITYVSTYGKESNRSDPSVGVTTNPSTVVLTSIPVSPETQVTARKIYRDLDGDAQYRFVATISDNTTTTYTDNASQADISTLTAPEPGGPIDNSPPENMAFVAPFEAYIFGVLASDRNTIVWSEANEPEYWPTVNSRTFHTQITALSPILGGLLIFGTDWMVAVTGGEGGSRSIVFNEVNPELGCVNARSVQRVKQAIMLVYEDGPYLTTNGQDSWYLGSQIRDQIDAARANIPSSFLIHDRTRFRVLWFLGSTVFAYNYGNIGTGQVSPEGQGVDSLDLRVGKWSKISFPAAQVTNCTAIVETTADDPEVWLGADNGIVYVFDSNQKNWAVGSSSEAISSILETTYEKLLQDSDREAMLRYLTIKGSGEAASTWTATLYVARDAGGSFERSISRSVVIGPGITSHKYAVPRGYQGAYCKLKLENAVLGERGVVESARVHFVPRPARGER